MSAFQNSESNKWKQNSIFDPLSNITISLSHSFLLNHETSKHLQEHKILVYSWKIKKRMSGRTKGQSRKSYRNACSNKPSLDKRLVQSSFMNSRFVSLKVPKRTWTSNRSINWIIRHLKNRGGRGGRKRTMRITWLLALKSERA